MQGMKFSPCPTLKRTLKEGHGRIEDGKVGEEKAGLIWI